MWRIQVTAAYGKSHRKGAVSTFAGSATYGHKDGAGTTAAQFSFPTGIAVDLSGNLYVGDTGNQRIRKIEYK